MPEGPEIRRMVDGIAKAVEGEVAERVSFGLARLQHWESELAGRRVSKVSARGKAVLVEFAPREVGDEQDRYVCYSHNQLYGKWFTHSVEKLPQSLANTTRSLRFSIVTSTHAAKLYSASDIEIIAAAELDRVGYLQRLGPDILNESVSVQRLLDQFTDKRFSGRALAGLLLDQRFIAGIGNYLRSEILYYAAISPTTKPKQLNEQQQLALADAVLLMVQRAYQLKGVTNDPDREQSLKDQGVPFGKRRHYAFLRAGEPCYACGTLIEKVTVASRRLYLCPMCQAA